MTKRLSRGVGLTVAALVAATQCLDATDEEAMGAIPLARMETVVVTIGSRATESSLLTVAVLEELRIPRIVARAFDERHARLLRRLGVHEVLNPEDLMGRRLASRLTRPAIRNLISLGGDAIADVEMPEAFVDATLAELDLEGRFGLALLGLLRRDGRIVDPGSGARVESGDRGVLRGSVEGLERLADLV